MFDRNRHLEAHAEVPAELRAIRVDTGAAAEANRQYIEKKTPDQNRQALMLARLQEFEETGADALFDDIDKQFPQFEQIDQQISDHYGTIVASGEQSSESVENALTSIRETLLAPTREKMRGQEHKLQRAEQYTAAMLQTMNKKISEYVPIPGQEAVKIELTKQFVQAIYDAINAITYQDMQATAVMIGDHGWSHLTQDFRDALNIATAAKGEPLTTDEVLILGFAAAYHDIGYASPQISGTQKQNVDQYFVDQGHPLLGAAFIRKNQEVLEKIFKPSDLDLLHGIVMYHENPDKSDIAGKQDYLLKSFAQADAAAAFGIDKVPSGSAIAPELLKIARYKSELKAIRQELNNTALPAERANQLAEVQRLIVQEIAQEKERMLARLGQTLDATYLAAIRNASEHVSEDTLQYAGPRFVGEMNPPRIIDNKLTVDVFGGAATALSQTGAYVGAEKSLAKQVLKIYTEQASQPLSKEVQAELESFVLNPQPISPESLVATIASYSADKQELTLKNPSDTVRIRFYPHARAENNQNFTNQVVSELTQAYDKIAQLTNAASASNAI